jgi:excisionase family DNA binding protein
MESRREVTDPEAARILNLPSDAIVRLIDEGALAFRMEGSRRLFLLALLLECRDAMVAPRRAALDQMTADAELLGLYY